MSEVVAPLHPTIEQMLGEERGDPREGTGEIQVDVKALSDFLARALRLGTFNIVEGVLAPRPALVEEK